MRNFDLITNFEYLFREGSPVEKVSKLWIQGLERKYVNTLNQKQKKFKNELLIK